ncbi:MAG: sulfotransferase [Phycisphaerales bacterium]|nr:MAG: sulfotransferase [Phycisphaerales bacterium]
MRKPQKPQMKTHQRGATSARTQMEFARAKQAFEAGDWNSASEICRQILKKNKKDVHALQLMGRIMAQSGRDEEAISYFNRSLKHNPRDPAVHFLLAELALVQGRAAVALDRLDKALRLKPSFNTARIQKAAVLERIGRYDEARQTIANLPVRGKDAGYLTRILARIALHTGRHQEAVDLANAIIDQPGLGLETTMQLAFIRGRAYDHLGEPQRAMESWDMANRLIRTSFDPEAYRRAVDRELEFFSRSTVERLPSATNHSELPVFIAGMPRSGTTLIEQIIDAHPRGHGAGELTDIDALYLDLPQRLGTTTPYPHCLPELAAEEAEGFAEPYLQKLRKLAGRDALRVVNKSLLNYRCLGLISRLFPGARVLYSWRDPVDVCLSIYMNDLHPTMHPYSTDLAHIGLAYRQAERLLNHWKEVLDLPVLEVRYEQLVSDQEPETRRMIDFCSLDWHESCLNPHSSGRTVMTLSYHQVSKPMYKSAIGRYERYRPYLGPLFEALGCAT